MARARPTVASSSGPCVVSFRDTRVISKFDVADLGCARKIALVKLWKWEPENLPSVIHSIRTAIAATISLAVARVFGLPEAYWAAIATLVVMQSTLGATLLISVERIAATALGALAGALLATWFTQNPFVFAAAVFVLGLLCSAFRMEKSAYRYASITLAIILLIPRSNAAWIIALHRFFEVSVGIVVALVLAAVWPEHQSESAKQGGE
jgi:uncharacterized membrane protein YgaE (UPF0421/DUF939 family)